MVVYAMILLQLQMGKVLGLLTAQVHRGYAETEYVLASLCAPQQISSIVWSKADQPCRE